MDNLVAVSSWALHRTLGVAYYDSPLGGPQPADLHSATTTPLLDLPSELQRHQFSAMQLCHFHLPSRETQYIADMRSSLRDANVELLTLLIDDGDVSDPEQGEASVPWTANWVRIAAELGASRARLIAGKQAYSKETIDMAFSRLMQIAAVAEEVGVILEIENWHALLATPAAVHELLDRSEGMLRLNADFGNWPKPERYETLPQIFHRAETCHAKFEFVSPTELDLEDTEQLLTIAKNANFSGPMVLVNGGHGTSDWDGLAIQRRAIECFIGE